MKHIKKISVFALLLLVIGVVGSLATFNLMDRSTKSIEQVVDSTNIQNITIRSSNERVELLPTNDSELKVEYTGNGKDIENRLDVKVNGDTLTVQTKERRNFFNINFFVGSRELLVYVPEKEYQSLKINVSNGKISASNLTIKDIDSTTANGRIELKQIIANNVQVNSSNGKVELVEVEGTISGETKNGSLSLSTSHLDRSIELKSSNGSIEILTEKEPTNAVLDLKTSNGKVTVFGSTDYDSVIGTGEHVIKLTTSNGSIRIEK